MPCQSSDPRPKSAVSSGVGMAGLTGLGIWSLIANEWGMAGPYAAAVAVLACAVPMILWSLVVDRVQLSSSTGIDWQRPPAGLAETLPITAVKITGLWATWALIAGAYAIGRWYWEGAYLYAMQALAMALPLLLIGSIPYLLWLDRRAVEARDGAYALGLILLGQGANADRAALAEHARQWTVKAFFTAFMISIVPGNWQAMIASNTAHLLSDPLALAQWLIAGLFMIDVVFATVGYVMTFRPLDSHIRSANPYAAGWAAALICYPPFIMMGPGAPLDYHRGTQDWNVWLAAHPALIALAGAALVLLAAIYAWATVAFGLRFANLTNRGILTHGPYRWTKHPAYLAKTSFWWLATMPFLTTGSWIDSVRNSVVLAIVTAVYYWRARTEERHLMADPAYRAYAEWMDRNAPIPRLLRRISGRAAPALAAAEEPERRAAHGAQ